MTIENGYYVAYCTSKEAPTARKNADTFYLPVDVKEGSDGYEYKEYRIDLNADMQLIPTSIILNMAAELDNYRKAVEKIGEKLNQNPEKLGYKWKAMYTNGNFAYELVEDSTAVGTRKNPIQYVDGIVIKEYFFYADGNDIYVGVGTGVPESIADTRYLEKM